MMRLKDFIEVFDLIDFFNSNIDLKKMKINLRDSLLLKYTGDLAGIPDQLKSHEVLRYQFNFLTGTHDIYIRG